MLNFSMLKLIEHLTAKSKGLRCGTEYLFVIFTSPLKPIIIYPGGGAVEDHMTFRGKGGESTVAHNCHGKTKSHGTTNFTHGKTKFIHGKTQKTSWSAVVISIWNGMSCNTHCSLEKPPFFELAMFCCACGSVVDEDANFCKSCGRGTFLNLKCSYLHFF